MKKLLLLTIISGVLHSCVLNKEVYTKKLSENFEEQQETFREKRSLQDSIYNFDFYYSDDQIEKDYEIVSYNHVTSWLPLKLLIFKSWQNKYKLHQYMHNAYCLGILPTIDGMIVEPDLNGVNYIRYKDSKKDPFVIPVKQSYSSSLAFGGGVNVNFDTGIRPVFNGSYLLSRNLNCLKTVRHEIGMLYGLRKKETFESGSYSEIDKYGGFFSMNYRAIASYNISEYFSNTWNKGRGKIALYTEIGLNTHFLQINRESFEEINGTTLSYFSKRTNTAVFGIGAYAGLRFQLGSDVNLILSASNGPVRLLNFASNKYGSENSDNKNSNFSFFNFNYFMPDVLVRLSFGL